MKKWIGIDLDGTLAETTVGNKIGKPIRAMKELVLRLYHSEQYDVKVFTARAENKAKIAQIKQWLKDNHLPDLDITNVKDSNAILIIDNIALTVIKDRGIICEESLEQLDVDLRPYFLNYSPRSTAELI